MIIRELLVKLGVITDTTKVKDFDGAVEKLRDHMEDLVAAGKKAAVAAGAVATALGLQAIATAESAIEIERQAAALGLSTDAYQEWRSTVGTFGTDAKDLADGFGQVAQVIGDATGGSKNAVATFKSLGIAVADLKGKSVEEVFYLIADGLERTTDSGDRLRAANVLLGEQLARQLLPLLIQGGDGLDSYREQARRLGGVMDTETIEKAKQAAMSFATFRIILQGVRNEIGLAVLPVVEQLANILGEYLAENRDLIGLRLDRVMRGIGDAVEDLTAAFYDADEVVTEKLGGWDNVFQRLKSAVAVLAASKGLMVVAAAVTALSDGFKVLTASATATSAGGLLAGASLSTVLGWAVGLAAAIVFLYLVIDDLWTYWRGGESVIGNFLASSERGRVTLSAFGDAARAVGGLLSSMFDALKTFAGILLPLLEPLLPMLGGIADGFIQVFGNQALASLRAFTAGLTFLAELIQFTTGSIADLVALVKGNAGLGEILDRFGGRAGDLVGAGGRMVGQGMLALPGMGSLTAGGKSASQGGIYVPASAPATVPVRGGGGMVATTTNTIGGDTYYVNGASTRELDELQYRQGQKKGRALTAVAGTGQ